MQFGDRIKLLREKLELTQEQMANKVGISRLERTYKELKQDRQ